MIEPALWISFVVTVVILVITPGPSVLLATANSMKYGPSRTTGTILGDLSANLLQIMLASLGLASIVISSGELIHWIKWLGVGYLLFIGLRKIITRPQISLENTASESRGFWSLYVEGFLMSAANPKAIVFFAALFPLFITESLPFAPQVLILAITFLTLDGISLLVYAFFATRLRTYLEDNQKIHFQNRIVGFLLILSGIMLAMVSRTAK